MTPWGAAGSFDIDFSFPVKTSVRLALCYTLSVVESITFRLSILTGSGILYKSSVTESQYSRPAPFVRPCGMVAVLQTFSSSGAGGCAQKRYYKHSAPPELREWCTIHLVPSFWPWRP